MLIGVSSCASQQVRANEIGATFEEWQGEDDKQSMVGERMTRGRGTID